jgi:hypothetical protein
MYLIILDEKIISKFKNSEPIRYNDLNPKINENEKIIKEEIKKNYLLT